MSIKDYSTTPNNNQTVTGINWAEGQLPSTVNNSARQMMADTREQWNDAEWFEYLDGTESGTITYVANNQFKVTGADVSSHYHIGRKVRIVGSLTGTIYQTITAVSYSAGDTTVTIDGTGLNNEALAVSTGILSAVNSSVGSLTVGEFTSNGIDDNATSTQLTITDTVSTFGGNLTMSDGKLVQTDSLSGNTVATFANTSTTNPNGMYIATSNYAGNASNYLIRGANSGGNAFSIYTDGSADFADVTLSNGKLVQSDSLSGNTVATFANIASSNPNIMYMAVNNYAGNASNYFLRGDNSGGNAFSIYTDGSAYYSGAIDASAGITVSDGFLSVDTHTNKTVASGAITATKSFHKLGGEGGVADDLDTINGGSDGDILVLMAISSSVNITAKDGTGNLRLAGGDFIMTTSQDTLVLIYSSGAWFELSRSDNA